MTKRIGITLLALALIVSGFVPGAFAEGKGKVEIGYVEWACATASTNLVKAVLSEKMGYDVEITPVSAAAMWQGVGSGDLDGLVCAWLETTHGHYLEKVKDNVENLGPNLHGTRIGLVVPAYVTIDSIAQMNEHADKFDGKIIGIDPGAGIMSKTEKAIKDYGLSKFELMEGSDATMTAVLKDKVANKQWVVITGWTPHWMFGKWDLKYLDDPKGIYGGEEHIDTIVRNGFKKEMPEVYKFLDKYSLTPKELQTMMAWNAEGADPYESAKRWMKENADKVEGWIK
jgi:glycine betaine/proline transport system substrate-binding protein